MNQSTERIENLKEENRYPPGPLPPKDGQKKYDRFTVRPMGQLFAQVIEQFGDTEKSELYDFTVFLYQNLREKIVDAVTLAEQAPETLQSLAEELGMNIEEIITGMQQQFEEMRPTIADSFSGQLGMQDGIPCQ
jgi:rubrerythrin